LHVIGDINATGTIYAGGEEVSGGGGAMYSGVDTSLADGDYLQVTHNQATNKLVAIGWVYDSASQSWKDTATVSSSSVGSGFDGSVTISASKNINTDTIASGRSYADGIAYKVDASTCTGTSLTTINAVSGIAADDEVLLINLQGASADYTDVGNYEFLRISSVSGTTVNFTSSIQNSYDGSTASNQKVVIQRVPNYINVTLDSSGSLTASAWDGLATTPTGTAGYYTGIVAFRATGTVNVSGDIDVSEKGFRSGTGGNQSSNEYGQQGESTSGGPDARTSAVNVEGGGGGGASGIGGSYWPNGAGGGGYGTAGGNGDQGGGNSATPGYGGSAYGTTDLSKIYFGSAGGVSTSGTSSGGGIVIIHGTQINVSGHIYSIGDAGERNSGGGAGGSIYLSGITLTLGTNLVTAAGGAGGDHNPSAGSGDGGSGGSGRIAISYDSFLSGSTNPTASTSTLPSLGYVITQPSNNAVRLFNWSGETQNVRLDVIPTAGASASALWTDQNDYIFANNATSVVITDTGNVGIGTTSPGAKLEVSSTLNTAAGGLLIASGNRGLSLWHDTTDNTITYIDSKYDSSSAVMNFRMRAEGTPVNAMTILGSGNVGIGTVSPGSKLSISATNRTDPGSPAMTLSSVATATGDKLGIAFTMVGNESRARAGIFAIAESPASSPGYGASLGFFTRSAADGSGLANSDERMKITSGGSCTGSACDIAESISVSENEPLEAGDVVVIVSENGREENVTKSTKPFDVRVAGVFSTKPLVYMDAAEDRDGILMVGTPKDFSEMKGTMHEGKIPLALAGQVPVKVSTENGLIGKGDLLTTSSTPGHAMKCPIETNEQKLKCMGAVLGKALEPCHEETCKITALVSLQ